MKRRRLELVAHHLRIETILGDTRLMGLFRLIQFQNAIRLLDI
jgi:hypothetical protein